MATLTVQQVGPTGTAVTAVAASGGGDSFPAGDHTYLRVINGGGSSITATVASPQTCSQGGTHPLAVAVAAGATKDIGPLPSGRFTDPNTGLASVTYSAVTSVTVAAVSV